MSYQQPTTFQDALDIVESLPDYQQEDLIETVWHRLIERKRDLIAENVKQAREEYARGEVKRGTIEDLMRELSE